MSWDKYREEVETEVFSGDGVTAYVVNNEIDNIAIIRASTVVKFDEWDETLSFNITPVNEYDFTACFVYDVREFLTRYLEYEGINYTLSHQKGATYMDVAEFSSKFIGLLARYNISFTINFQYLTLMSIRVEL